MIKHYWEYVINHHEDIDQHRHFSRCSHLCRKLLVREISDDCHVLFSLHLGKQVSQVFAMGKG